MDTQKPAKRQKTILVLSALVVIMVCASVLLFVKYKREANTNPVTQQQQLTKQLGSLIEMPNEAPVITTVLDRSKLTNATLAGKAHNGDTLFIFPKSKRLVLYRPSDKKVVDMLNIQGS